MAMTTESKVTTHTEVPQTLVGRADLVLFDDPFIGVAEFEVNRGSALATLSITRIREEGSLDLVAVVTQLCPGSEDAALAVVRAIWPSLTEALSADSGGLNLKSSQPVLSQEQVTRHARAHLAYAYGQVRIGETLQARTVVAETAIMWRLLHQFGSFRPAEILSEVTGVKPRTINARLQAARDKHLIPQLHGTTE